MTDRGSADSRGQPGFRDIFREFVSQQHSLKVIYVASSRDDAPNCAPKMLAAVEEPNLVYFLDYGFTRSFKNISLSHRASLSFMNDIQFVGYRLTGQCRYLEKGSEEDRIRAVWRKRVASYLADRLIRRLHGEFSSKVAEESLPDNFVVARFEAQEASLVMPDRVFRADSFRP